MEMLIGSSIVVHNPTKELKRFCKDNLILTNPDYITRQRLGKWTGCVPKNLYLYEESNGNIIIPYGLKDKLASFGLEKQWDAYPQQNFFKTDYCSNIALYDYQEDTVQKMLKAINGIVIMPCGSGKTQTALEAVARLGLKTLWLTHTQDLLNQSMARAKSCFDCDSALFGTITAGKVNISGGVTFATVQTMCKLDLSKYREEWAVVVVDECQHCCGSPTRVSQFYRVVNSLFAPYKFGLTATPKRTDGLERSMFALLGDTIAEISKEQVADMTCNVRIKTVETNYFPDNDNILNGDGTINYGCLITDLVENDDRFQVIMKTINSECRHFSMVLANRVAFLQKMQQAYKGKSVCLSSINATNKSRQERKQALEMLNSGEIDCIFATYQLAAEGLDCPNLRYIVFTTPEKNERTVTQAVGRVARKADGKDYGTVIDFIDGFGMYRNWAKSRNSIYKKLGCTFENS
jgi:superfamily II DNA or RNA helicase